jgi:hypothetical protein
MQSPVTCGGAFACADVDCLRDPKRGENDPQISQMTQIGRTKGEGISKPLRRIHLRNLCNLRIVFSVLCHSLLPKTAAKSRISLGSHVQHF